VVKPFELSFPVEFAYYIVYPESKTLTPKVDVLIRRLREEVTTTVAPRRPSLVSSKEAVEVPKEPATARPRRTTTSAGAKRVAG
jgi:hypothetical protein